MDSAHRIFWCMEPIQKCLDPLRTLVATADVDGIGLAEKAVDEYLANFPDVYSKVGAIFVLQNKCSGLFPGASGAQVEFGHLVLDYIDNRLRALNEPSDAAQKP